MDLLKRIGFLESVHDWQTLAEELEKVAQTETDPQAKADALLMLGRLLDERFLQGVKALKHFQDAYKLNNRLSAALEHARATYWELGKTNMVQKLLDLQLKLAEGEVAVALLNELGDVLVDAGDTDRAAATFSRALATSGDTSEEARAGLMDVQVAPDDVTRYVEELAGQDGARAYLRAARVARRFGTADAESLLALAYDMDPLDRQIASSYEGLLVQSDRASELEVKQRALIAAAPPELKGDLAFRFGARWALRHQDLERGSRLLEEALTIDPGQHAAFAFLRDQWGGREGNWDKVHGLLDRLAQRDDASPFFVSQGGLVAWQRLGNLIRARQWFERLAEVAPEHPALLAFESQIGEKITPGGAPAAAPILSAPPVAAQPNVEVAPPPAAAAPPVAPASVPPPASPEPPPAAAASPAPPPAAAAPSAPPPATTSARPPASSDAGRVADLRAKLEKLLAQKRMTEYVKTLVELAEAVDDENEKVALYSEAADLYTNKFPNAAEAVKAYEAVLAIDERNPTAIEHLKQTYEKRRDWEKLIGLLRREAALLGYGAERGHKFLEIARLATERVKKPEVCIDLWREVLENEPDNVEALAALAGLYERSKEWALLVEVLERQVEVTGDAGQKEQIYGKLGQFYGERLNDDVRAVEAWRKLLALNPQDRKAQEALKKKYLALGQWDELEVFYADSGKWDEFIRLLEAQEAKETDEQSKISLLVKTAQLWVTQKGKLDRAARAYEKVLSLDPVHLAAAEALIPIYGQANNNKGLASAIEVKLKHDVPEEERFALLREVAGLYETKLKEPGLAFERYLAAFELQPEDEGVGRDVERAARATGGFKAVTEAMARCIERADDRGDRDLALSLRLRLGRVELDELTNVDAALTQFRAVYDADSENAEAIAALERLYRETGKFQDLLAIYEKKRELVDDADERKRILFAIASLYERELTNPRAAVDTYRTVLDDAAMDPAALAALDRLYRELEDWEPYVETLRSRIELDNSEAELVDLKYRLGTALEKHVGDPAGALESYREILFLDPGNDPAREALERLLESEDLRAEAASILQEIYEGRADWQKLIGVLEILAEHQTDPAERVAILRKISRVAADNMGNLQRAMAAQARALKEDPASKDARAELESLAAQADAWDTLDTTFTDIAEAITDPDLAREYYMRLASIDERLGKVDEATAGYEKVLSINPGDAEALAAMDALYRRTDRSQDLIKVYRKRIELADDPTQREELYAQMASVFEEKLGRPDDAIAAYREVLAFEPQSRVALTALDGLFSRQGRWEELAENLESQLDLAADEAEQTRLMLRLGALRESRMQQVDVAIDTYRQVLEREADNVEALSALERLGGQGEHELSISEILEPLYRQSGDYQKLIGVYEVQTRRSEDPSRKVELLHQIASLHEDAGGDLDSAFVTLARALAEDPSSEETRTGLDRLSRATGQFDRLAKVYENLAGRQSEPETSVSLYALSAAVYENDLRDNERAVGHYRKVLEIDPKNLEAAEALERIFRATEQYQELSRVLQQKAEIYEDLSDRKNALYQAASIEEDVLERPDQAIAAYRAVLALDEEDIGATDALIKLYLLKSAWPDLLAVYTQKADLVADAEEKKRIYYQVGAVYERELGDVQNAIDTYQRILEIDRDDTQALSRLDVLYQRAENWTELLTVLQHEAELARDPAESIGYQYRIAELWEKRLGDVPRALELYRDLITQMSDHEPTLAALEGIKVGTKDPLGAALVLEPIYDATGQWKKLVSVLEVQVTASEDAYQRIDLLHRIANLEEESLGDFHAAFDVYARAVREDPSHTESLANLERLAMGTERWPEAARLYDGELQKLREEPEKLVDLGLRLAQIFETQLEDVDNAVGRYRLVLEVSPENLEAIQSLDRLFVQTKRWSDLVPVLAREAEIGETPEDILTFKYRLGQVHQQHLKDLPSAINSYREVLAAAPEHTPTLEALEQLFESGVHQLEIGEILEPLYQSAGEWGKLGMVIEAELGQQKSREERLATFARLGELHEERLLAAEGALEVYVRALKEFPDDGKVLEEVERLAANVQDGWEQLANAYADVLGLHPDKAIQTTIGKRLARVFEEELGDINKAEETYRYVLQVEELEADALAELDRIYSSLEQWADLAAVLEKRILATSEKFELVELHLRLGEVYEEKLVSEETGRGELDHAVRVYKRVFDELDPTNEVAITALERIYTALGAWTDLRVVLERQLENATGDSQEADIRAKMATVLADRLGDTPRAIETWKRVLELRGDDPEALHGLANLHERERQWAELTDVLGRHFDIAQEDSERAAVLVRRARLFERELKRDDAALEDYERVLDIEYNNVDALYAITDIYRRRQDSERLVEWLHRTAEQTEGQLPPENMIAIFRELATTYQTVLDRPQDAIDAWRKLLEVDPKDFDAMASLETLLRAEDKWEEVIDVKNARGTAFEDPDEKIREYLEVASIWEHQVNQKDRGTPAYEAILEIDPTHDQAFSALEKLHAESKRSEPLVELYLARLETRDDTNEKTEILRKVAKVFDEDLDDKPQAFDALLTALELDVGNMDTVRYLERITQATNRWGELLNTVNGWLQQETQPQRKITLCLRLAKWYAEDNGRPEYAQPYYQQILKLDPNNVAVLRQMANFYKKSGRFQEQGQHLQLALSHAVTDVDRKEILTEIGEVLDRRMNETDQGLSFYDRALQVDPHHLPALEHLERIYTDRNQPNELVDVLAAKAKGLTDSALIAATKLRAAGLYETTLNQVEKAGQVYREVLEHDSSNILAMRGLERVYSANQQWPDLVQILEMQLDVVTTERERIDVLMKVAKIQEELFVKPDLAAVRLEQVVEIDPNHEPAYEGLERCYRQRRQWHDLIQTYDRHINAIVDRQQKIDLWAQQAQVYADELQDVDRAIDAYLNIVAVDETNVFALDALSKLYEKQGDAGRAIEFMTRVAELTSDGRQRVEMYYRIGKQLDERMNDRMGAQDNFERALDLDPSHQPTLAALRAIATDSGDWDRAARYLEQEQLVTESPRLRAKLLVELGKMRDETLGEHDLAIQSYELAHQSDPDNEDAAMPLLNEYIQREAWEHAEPLADMLVRKGQKRERHEQHELFNKYGKVLAARQNFQGAFRAYQSANQLDLTNQETIRGLAEVSFALSDWPGALTNYQKVLTSLEEHDTEQRAYVYYRLGQVKLGQGQAKQAVNNFEKALQVDPTHRPTLDAMVSLYEQAKDWPQVCHYKAIILDNLVDGPERFALLNQIGEIWAERGNNAIKAIEAYEQALDLEPDNHVLLHKLLPLYQKALQWERMVDALQRIASITPNPVAKAKVVNMIGQLYRDGDKLNDPMRAVDAFNEALDLNPEFLEAFERIDKILTQMKDWRQLERSYRKMLHRIAGKGNGDLEHKLWDSLGLIYRDRLHEDEKAIEAFRMGVRIKADDMRGHLILAELFEKTDQLDLSIQEQHTVVRLDPMRVEPYRKLYTLYLTKQTYDEAWCLAAALSFLRQAGEEEKQFFEDYRPQGIPSLRSRLDNEGWRRLFHEEESVHLGKIFEAIAYAALRAKTDDLKKKNEMPVLDQRFLHDPKTSTVTFARTFGWAAEALGLPRAPSLYIRSDVQGALSHVPVDPPSSLAGQTVLTGFSAQELTFIVGKHLAYYRGEHYIKAIFPTVTELTVLLFAGVRLVAPQQPAPPEIEKQVMATAAALQRYLQPIQLDALRDAVKRFIADGAKANIKRWVQTVELTSVRAGLLLCGDLEIARKIVAAEPQLPGDLSPQDKLKELLTFAVSDDYFRLRQQLGLGIKVEG